MHTMYEFNWPSRRGHHAPPRRANSGPAPIPEIFDFLLDALVLAGAALEYLAPSANVKRAPPFTLCLKKPNLNE